MKEIKTVFSKKSMLLYFLLGSISCSNPNKLDISNDKIDLALQIEDSVLVHYMEELTLMDATNDFENFLALNANTDEVLIFNKKGNVVNSFKNERDSPNAINDIFSLSFKDNLDIIVGARPSQLAIYDKTGDQKLKFKLATLVPRGSSIIQKQLFSAENNKILGHLHAYPDSSFSNGVLKPTLTLIDLEGKSEPKSLPGIPSKSKYSDGKFHGYVFPILNYTENKLMLVYSNDPILHIYNYSNEELNIHRSIDLGITNFVEIHSSSDEKSYDFDKNHREMKPGMIWRILSNDEYIYIMYAKGISDSKFESEVHNRVTKESIQSNPMYLMVLNKDFDILQRDIIIPFYLLSGLRCVSNDGTFIGRKSPIFSEIESDYEIFYTYKLKEII